MQDSTPINTFYTYVKEVAFGPGHKPIYCKAERFRHNFIKIVHTVNTYVDVSFDWAGFVTRSAAAQSAPLSVFMTEPYKELQISYSVL